MEVHHWEEYICGDDKHWLVDLDTDEWIRIIVVEEPGFIRGSGMWEPQTYNIDAIRMYKNWPNDLCLNFNDFWISPAGDRPLQEPAEDIPFGKWMEDPANQDMFIGYIKEIIKHQMESMTNLFDQVSGV